MERRSCGATTSAEDHSGHATTQRGTTATAGIADLAGDTAARAGRTHGPHAAATPCRGAHPTRGASNCGSTGRHAQTRTTITQTTSNGIHCARAYAEASAPTRARSSNTAAGAHAGTPA